MPMTDLELIKFLGVEGYENAGKYIATLPPELRALYNRMADIETEWKLYTLGLGSKPTGVILCGERDPEK